MLKRFVKLVGGDPNQREINNLTYLVEEVNALETQFETLSPDELANKTSEFREKLSAGFTLDDIMVEAFATVREASKRTIGLRHYDVQLIGGAILHQGKIIEMKTGEGKTLVATLPIYLNALVGKGVHLITVNDYLARRDARWMAPIYSTLGLSIGVLQMAARTENGKKAFLVDLDRESPHEDQHQLVMVPRKEAYLADITYGTNSEFGFDYLRDNMTMLWDNRVQRGHYFAIIDEVDNVLIDEARTPLIISGPAQDEAEWYVRMAQVVNGLRVEDIEVNEKDRNVTLTEIGEIHVEQLLGMALGDPDRPEDITPEQARTIGYLEQALRAQYLFRRNKDYLIQAGKVVIIDEFTGRLMPGRRWSDGLHQAVEAKEGVKVQSESVTYATITIQNYFRMYEKLAGMTGTAVTEAEEFEKIYKLGVLALPTNLEYQASRADTELVEVEEKDTSGYKYIYYTYSSDIDKVPYFWKRKDYPDVVYRTEEAKLRAIALEIMRYHVLGRPLLVGTTSVELSELVSRRLKSESLRRLAMIQLIRNAWFKQNDRIEDGRVIEVLQFLNVDIDQLNISDMRKTARDLGLTFNPEDDENLKELMTILEIPPDMEKRLTGVLKAGIPHNVLNARKHTEESQIIAGAGAFGAVMIATNMAGRGVDIKLGGELAEEIIAAVNRILRRAGYDDPYDMNLNAKYQALMNIDPAEYGIYDAEINFFKQHVDEMESVRRLGGLHVIGSERHEARRIDNQLRGRAARQGDPGSSRFYLSMEDELMRLFGGAQADSLMQRMKIDDSLPLEAGLVSRIVEQAQSRVEGANFDVRKHLLEYDDVLNTQRTKIYQQRDLIFQKQDLSENINEMLQTEVSKHIPASLNTEEEAWKLLAWLNQIQPPITSGSYIFPSFMLKLISDEINHKLSLPANKEDILRELVHTAHSAIEAEKDHLIKASVALIEKARDNLDQQLIDRMDAIDTYFDGLSLDDDAALDINTVSSELVAILHLPIKVNQQFIRQLEEDPDQALEDIRSQVEQQLYIQTLTRLIGSIERRLEESINLNPGDLINLDWDHIPGKILHEVSNIFSIRISRYIGKSNVDNEGAIHRDLSTALSKVEGAITHNQILQLLLLMPRGTRSAFDKKTHRRVLERTTRFNYVYLTAKSLIGRNPQDVKNEIMEHLNNVIRFMNRVWGFSEWSGVASVNINHLNEKYQFIIQETIGKDNFTTHYTDRLVNLPQELQDDVKEKIGNLALTEIYRQLMIRVISDLWVDYLTQMEGLRVSIGLEAYAQRDPLVQYKNRAFELYQELLNNVRSSVINRVFTFKPRETSQSTLASSRETQNFSADNESDSSSPGQETPIADNEAPGKKIRESTISENVSVSTKRRRGRKR